MKKHKCHHAQFSNTKTNHSFTKRETVSNIFEQYGNTNG